MATALARGCIESGLVTADQVVAADPSQTARERFKEQVPGVTVYDDAEPVLAAADIVILAIKPQVMTAVLAGICSYVTSRHLVVSIAAGVTLSRLGERLPPGTRLIRVMPNTPCLVGLGASCYSRGENATDEDASHVEQILSSVGRAFAVEEQQLDAVTGLSGSGPAFVYRVIESLAEGGVQMGLPAELALELATLTARGAAEMVIVTRQSPAELCEQVTSPGGTTVAGLEALMKFQGQEAIRAAVVAAALRSRELGRD